MLTKQINITAETEIDFSKGIYKEIYSLWLLYHLRAEKLTPQSRQYLTNKLDNFMQKLGIEELDLQYYFANHKLPDNIPEAVKTVKSKKAK